LTSSGTVRPLAILCGGGGLALEAARLARENGRDVLLIGIIGVTAPEVEAFPHVWVRMGEVGKLFAAMRGRVGRRTACRLRPSAPRHAERLRPPAAMPR